MTEARRYLTCFGAVAATVLASMLWAHGDGSTIGWILAYGLQFAAAYLLLWAIRGKP